MAAEVRLTDGATIKTDRNTSSDDVLKRLGAHTTFQAIRDENNETYRVNSSHVVFVRDVT